MEEQFTATTSPKSTVEAQKHLKRTFEFAFQIRTAMNDELWKPRLCSTSSANNSNAVTDGVADSSNGGVSGGAPEVARFQYKSSLSSLCDVLGAIRFIHEELSSNNKHMKHLIDQLREHVNDISAWRSSL